VVHRRRHSDVIAASTESRGKVNTVHFAQGIRTAWHRHANGQTLHVTEGVGLTGTGTAMSFRSVSATPCGARGGVALARRRTRPLHDPPRHLGRPRRGQDGPESEWAERVTDVEYSRQPA
jgi:hypothetical protein